MLFLLFLKKRQNLKLSSAANYRWRFKGKLIACSVICTHCCRMLIIAKASFLFRKILSILPPMCQTVWIQILTVGPDIGSNYLHTLGVVGVLVHPKAM